MTEAKKGNRMIVQTLINFTLGDGHIAYYPEHKQRSASFSMSHSIHQREYLWHKVERLLALGLEGSERIDDRVLHGKVYKTVTFKTKAHPDILTAYKWTYNKRRKAIDKALLRRLNAESLAYWFMDDGSGSKTIKSVSKVNGTRYIYTYPNPKIESYSLATHSCTLDELLLIKDWMQSEFSISTALVPDHRAKTCLGTFLRIRGVKNKDVFREVIRPYVVPCMSYKITGLHTFKGEQYSAVETEREDSLKDEATVHGF